MNIKELREYQLEFEKSIDNHKSGIQKIAKAKKKLRNKPGHYSGSSHFPVIMI